MELIAWTRSAKFTEERIGDSDILSNAERKGGGGGGIRR